METIIVKRGFSVWSLVCSSQTAQIQYIYSAFIVHEEKIDSFINSPHLFFGPVSNTQRIRPLLSCQVKPSQQHWFLSSLGRETGSTTSVTLTNSHSRPLHEFLDYQWDEKSGSRGPSLCSSASQSHPFCHPKQQNTRNSNRLGVQGLGPMLGVYHEQMF